jgi:hypothetical protein
LNSCQEKGPNFCNNKEIISDNFNLLVRDLFKYIIKYLVKVIEEIGAIRNSHENGGDG